MNAESTGQTRVWVITKRKVDFIDEDLCFFMWKTFFDLASLHFFISYYYYYAYHI